MLKPVEVGVEVEDVNAKDLMSTSKIEIIQGYNNKLSFFKLIQLLSIFESIHSVLAHSLVLLTLIFYCFALLLVICACVCWWGRVST